MLYAAEANKLGAGEVKIAGHHPFVLDKPGVFWFIAEGHVSVQGGAVDVRHGPESERLRLWECKAGQCLFSAVDVQGRYKSRLMVVALQDVVLYEIPIKKAQQFFALINKSLTNALDAWVMDAAACPLFADAPPAERTALEVTKVFREKQSIYSRNKTSVEWLRLLEGNGYVLGKGELEITAGKDNWFPLTHELWMRTGQATRVDTRSTTELLKTRLPDVSLQELHNALLCLTSAWLAHQINLQRERLEARESIQKRITTTALTRLDNLFKRRKRLAPRGESLFDLVSFVAELLHLQAVKPQELEAFETPADQIDAITRSSNFRRREVRLADGWWEKDCGPLIAFTADTSAPVALVREGTVYRYFCPSEGVESIVDAALAKTLAPFAYTFYRRLPDGLLKPLDLLRFSLRGRFNDIAYIAALAVTVTLLGMLTPQATALIMDNAIPDADKNLLLQLAGGLLVVALGSAGLGIAQNLASIRLGVLTSSATQAAVWDRVLTLRGNFLRGFSSGDLLDRTNTVNQISSELSGATLSSLMTATMSLLNLGLLFYYSSKLAMIAVA
ncbi:MAG: hypothetical protein MJA83_17455, partial [Gammaproteobacteria bacterium]|nr:hypothetical protein [Gammaproteobacteria bacterium]